MKCIVRGLIVMAVLGALSVSSACSKAEEETVYMPIVPLALDASKVRSIFPSASFLSSAGPGSKKEILLLSSTQYKDTVYYMGLERIPVHEDSPEGLLLGYEWGNGLVFSRPGASENYRVVGSVDVLFATPGSSDDALPDHVLYALTKEYLQKLKNNYRSFSADILNSNSEESPNSYSPPVVKAFNEVNRQ